MRVSEISPKPAPMILTLYVRPPPPRLLLQANALGAGEEKTGVGGGEGIIKAHVSPYRHGSKASGRFQRRLEEASAEVAAESAAAPRIAVAAAGETETGEACLSGGGGGRGGTAGSGLGGESTSKTMKETISWGAHDDLLPGDGNGPDKSQEWTPGEDGRLERLVRECVFDFDLVAARFSSAGDRGYDDGGEGGDVLAAAHTLAVRSPA